MISAKRRRKTSLIIKKRLKQLKTLGWNDKDKALKQINRLSKRRAFGCSNSRCRICHWKKLRSKRRQYNQGYEGYE